ncbi:MAG: CobD/CbiB family protein [Betaproteobacteria bacterium]|nr:CobD/CbiB family protein [Betaproteobacteria bacterium]
MTLFALIAALALEHFYPLDLRGELHRGFARYSAFLENHLNAGQRLHGFLAWALAVLPLAALGGAGYLWLQHLSVLAAWAWNTAFLYFCLGFERCGRELSGVGRALKERDLVHARELLGAWAGGEVAELQAPEVTRVAIEQTFLCAHRQLFGVVAGFLVLSPLGPVGAVLYRSSCWLADLWADLDPQSHGDFGRFAGEAFRTLDWVPARLTAVSFAIVGDFEDALFCWRAQAASWTDKLQGIILSSGAGALGVKLGDPIHQAGGLVARPELGLGEEPDAGDLQSAMGLVWRTVVLWLALLALLTLARWAG